MRTFSQRPDGFVFSVIIMILFVSTIWISSVSALPQQQTSLGVKIINPAKGQQVAIGKNLTLSGTSSYNATSNCGVFVIVDGVRPYQKTIPTGQVGGNEYSKWKYTFTPAYGGTIRESINRITAKLICQANPANLTKFYSINVTGMIVPKQSALTRDNTAVAPLSTNNSSSLFYQTPLINQLSHPNSNSSLSSDSSSSHNKGMSSHNNGMSSHRYHSMYGKGHPNAMGSGKHNGGHCTYSDYKSNVCGS
jgi:hypothetical protein